MAVIRVDGGEKGHVCYAGHDTGNASLESGQLMSIEVLRVKCWRALYHRWHL